ncbi:hypothetical protein Bca101_065855 [Brassica carinata]
MDEQIRLGSSIQAVDHSDPHQFVSDVFEREERGVPEARKKKERSQEKLCNWLLVSSWSWLHLLTAVNPCRGKALCLSQLIRVIRIEPMSSPRTGSGTSNWRAEDSNALDLNNLPDDPSRDFFSFFEEGSSSSSSERETESLNKARELVLRNDTFPPHRGPPSFSYHQRDMHMGDLITSFKPMMYPPRLFSPSSLLPPPPPPPPLVQPYIYPPTSPKRPSSFPPRHTNDYYLHNNGTHHHTLNSSGCGGRAPPDSSYSFIGAPVANGSQVAPPISHPLPPHHGI